MRLKKLLLIISLLSWEHSFASTPTSPESTYFLTKAQVSNLTPLALKGSGDAALALSRFYSNVKLDLDAALKWAIIGAENGNANCMYTAYAYLEKRESQEDRERANFWLKKAISLGYKPAIDHQRLINH